MKTNHILRRGIIGAILMVALPTALSRGYEYETERDQMKFQAGTFENITVSLGLKTAGRLQALDHDDVYQTPRPSADDPAPAPVKRPGIDPGFQTAWGSMDFMANFDDLVMVYWEFYMSSRPHPDAMQGNQGYIYIKGLPDDKLAPIFNLVDIKAGEFEVAFGDHLYRRTDNARGQPNALVGNAVMDPRATEIGMEFISKPSLVNGLVGVSSGTPTGDSLADRGVGLHGKLWVDTERARLSASVYDVDHSDNSADREGGTRNNLFRSNRSGGPYSGVLDDGNGVGEIGVGNGQDVFAYQFDLSLDLGAVDLYANYGFTEDADTNGVDDGSPADEWTYASLEAVVPVGEDLFFAARYSRADADQLKGKDSSGYTHRIQAGLGYWLTNTLLVKMEYVTQEYKDFTEGETVSGVDAWRDPSFSGVIAEVSFAF